jgi:hypothetical protein
MINSKPGRGCPDVTRETRVSRTGSALRRNVDLQGGLVHADLDALTIAGGRACSTSTRLTHPVITNQTSPHFAETLPDRVPSLPPAAIGARLLGVPEHGRQAPPFARARQGRCKPGPIDHLLAKPDQGGLLPGRMTNGAGHGGRGIVRGWPLATARVRCEWHGSGTARTTVAGPRSVGRRTTRMDTGLQA